MSLRDKRNQQADDISKGIFLKLTLEQTGKDIDVAVDKATSSFDSLFWNEANSKVVGENTLDYRHNKINRFVDMKTRTIKEGIKPKKRYVVHNKIIWFNYNQMTRELAYGYTEAVKEEIRKLENENK